MSGYSSYEVAPTGLSFVGPLSYYDDDLLLVNGIRMVHAMFLTGLR